MAIASDALELYASRSLIEFVKSQGPMAIKDHAEWLRLIKAAGLEKEWCFLRTRERWSSGQVVDRDFVYRTDSPRDLFPLTRRVLNILAGHAPAPGPFDYSRLRIIVIPDEIMTDNVDDTIACMRQHQLSLWSGPGARKVGLLSIP